MLVNFFKVLILASRSATVLVIFVVAVLAFCLASVFAAMTGPITILPEDSDNSGGILDNLSAITDDTGSSDNSYGNPDYTDDYSSSSSSDDSQVETTTDSSSSDNSGVETTTDSGSSQSDTSSGDASPSTSSSSDSGVETTTE